MADLDNLKDKYEGKKDGKQTDSVKSLRSLQKELEGKKDSAPVRAVKQAVSGFRSQWSGIDDQGKVGVGKGVPGIYYDTVAIPALAGIVDDKYAPEFAVEADKKAGMIRDAIRKDMGIEAPRGALEHFANAGGTMLGQLPVPGAWLKRVLTPVKEAGIAGKVATSPIEYLSPIVDPKKINYGVGTGFGGTIGTVGEMLEEDPVKKALGGLIQKYEDGGKVGKVKSFFSAVDKAIDTLKQKKGTGEQILKEIEKAPGVKKEELELRKIREKLKDKKSITQDEVRALAAQSPAPNIKPIVRSRSNVGVPKNWQPTLTDQNRADLDALGISPVVNPEDGRMLGFAIEETGDILDYDTMFNMTHEDFGTTKKVYNDMMSAAARTKNQFNNELLLAKEKSAPKFEKYTTPGGENYREILLQLDKSVNPRDSLGGAPKEVPRKEAAQYLGYSNDLIGENSQVLIYPNGAYVERLPNGEYYGMAYNEDKVSANLADIEDFLASRLDSDMLAKGTPDYRSGHFDEPNILVHARVTDRAGPNGEKVLYVEEIQSDWHQSGRSKGYQEEDLKNKLAALTDERAKVFNEYKNIPGDQEPQVFELARLKTRLGEIDEEYAALQKVYEYGVPDAPFKKTSHELALKQILDMAANEGYDRVAIAPGSEQIKRYNMSSELDAIRALRDDRGLITLSGLKNNRAGNMNTETVVIEKLGIDPKDLPDYIGKERAEQILSGMGEDNIFELRGDDLKMTSKEGQGKKKIYDEILPNYLSKYAQKEFGAEPGEIDIFTKQGKSYEQYLDEIVEDPYRYIDEDEYFETIHERVTNRAAQQGYDLEDPDKWDELISRDTNEADDIWAAVENDFYEEKAKELATKDKGGSLKAFSVPVTPQMREKITGEGQKLFAAAPVVGVQTIPGMEEEPQQAAPEPQPEVEEMPMPLENGGKVGKVKSAAKAAMKKAKFTDKEREELAYLLHEKSNVAKQGESIAALDRALKEFSSDAPALYRGVYSSEISGSKMKPGEKLKLGKYSSFSEDPAIARRFGNANVVVELPSGGRGFNYMQQQIEDLMQLKEKDPSTFEAVDGDYLIDSLKEEAEWIMGSPEVMIKSTRKEGPLTIIESDFIVPEQEPKKFQSGGQATSTPRSELEDDPFVQTVLNAARHYQGGKEIEAGQMGIRKGPVTVGVNAANITDPGTRDQMQAQALFAAYRDRLGGVDVNASVNKPAQGPDGFYQGNVMASVPVGPGRAMAGVSGYKSPQKTDVSGYNFGYGQKVGPGYASGSVFQPKDRRQDTRYDVQYTIPFQEGGRAGKAKQVIEAAMKKAGQKKGQVADKNLTTLQDYHTSLGDAVRARAAEAQKQMDSWTYEYEPGQYVFTEHGAKKNLPPLKILAKSRVGWDIVREDPSNILSKKVIDPETGRAKRTPYEPGYKVRREIGDDWSEFTIPASVIKGSVEPDEPYKRGGPVGLQDGGRVGKTKAAAEKLLRVLHGSPTRIAPEQGKAIDVTTEPTYAVKRGTDKMMGKSGPPMVNQFDVPAGRILQFEEQYSPEDVAMMRRYFNKLPQGQAMRGEDIFDAAQGRDAILEGIAKAGGFAGYERPNTGAVGKGQWFRITEPEELVRKARGGLAQFSKPL
jgi:uncharacterized protein YidB (DUF937 family)